MMVIGVLTCLGGLFSLIASPVAGIASLASGVCCVLMSLLLGEYRAKMTMLLYPRCSPCTAICPPIPTCRPSSPAAPKAPIRKRVDTKKEAPQGLSFFAQKWGAPSHKQEGLPVLSHLVFCCTCPYWMTRTFTMGSSPRSASRRRGESSRRRPKWCRRTPPGTCSACFQC